MIKKIITEISEEDFRKLDLKVKRHERVEETIDGRKVNRFIYTEKSLNDILDENLEYLIESGYEDDYENLLTPVTIAIHEPGNNDYEESYLDKFMNGFTGMQTYQLGFGIKHLYSTRDYYECRDDYWRVRKDETKVIYRIKLSDKWINRFILKHKKIISEWNEDILPDGISPDYKEAEVRTFYDLVDGEWVEIHKTAVFRYEHCEYHIPYGKKE